MNLGELQEIVSRADFKALTGQIENDWFDCKGQPYQIDIDDGKRELAKDVSSFANADGGFVFVGIKTKQSTVHFGDEVEELRIFSQTLVNTAQYRDVIRSWVHPEIEGVNVRWVEVERNKGIVVITIPPQKDITKPFLIVRTLNETGRKIETVFGYVQRKGDSNQPLVVKDLQKVMRSGLHYEEQLEERLDGIEILLKNTVHKNQTETQKKIDEERIGQGIEKALEHDDLKDRRTIIISAYPNQPSQLKTIFLTTEGSIRKYLEHPPILRRHGWSLETLDQAKIMRGEMIRVVNGDRKVIDLYRDGALIFVGLAEHTFLAWHEEQKQKINPLAIIEVVHGFLTFYKLVLEDMEQPPSDFTVRVDFRNFHQGGVKSYLVPGGLENYTQLFEIDKKDASDDNGTISKTFLTKDFDAAVIGFEILKEVYPWFGIEEDKIPYIKIENGLKMIDVETIKKMGIL